MRSPEERLLEALRARGVRGLRRVRFRNNRRTVLSVSAAGETLNAHVCLEAAPGHVIDLVAAFLLARPGTAAAKSASRRLVGCGHVARALRREQRRHRRRQRRREQTRAIAARQKLVVHLGGSGCVGTVPQRSYLRSVYADLNRVHFGNRLPRELPIRLSSRMSRRFGHVKYGYGPQGRRVVHEIALNIDLMLAGNERHLWDTVMHEMAHVEAWLYHGDGGHGPAWRAVAERIGCEPTACTWTRIKTRGPRADLTRVPPPLDLAV